MGVSVFNFNPLEYVEELEKAGVPRNQAEVTANTLFRVLSTDSQALATKVDLQATEEKLQANLHATEAKLQADLQTIETKLLADLHATEEKLQAELHATEAKLRSELASKADLHATETKLQYGINKLSDHMDNKWNTTCANMDNKWNTACAELKFDLIKWIIGIFLTQTGLVIALFAACKFT